MKTNKEIKEIIKKYEFDQKTRTYSNKHFFKDNSFYASVRSNNDVEKALNYVNNTIQYFENFNHDLVEDDIDSLEKALGRYEETIHKVLACFDNPHCDFIYSADELMQLINNWDIFAKKISAIHMRKMCQD